MSSSRISIAVIGGGILGISSAFHLARTGRYQVYLFEKEKQLGGMSCYYSWQDLTWDRFYHVILSTDAHLLDFIRDIGLENELFWRETKSGFYGNTSLVSLSSSLDFLAFPFLTLWQKIRLVLGILYSSRIKDPARLKNLNARTWLVRVFGKRIYENIWDPLLKSKLGSYQEKASAAFIWATINRLYAARSSTQKIEKMGHVRGGYRRIFEAAHKKIIDLGVSIYTDARITKLKVDKTNTPTIIAEGRERSFDRVLLTLPSPEVFRLVDTLINHSFWTELGKTEYLSVACVFLVLKKKLSPFYVINLLDKALPFTGIIEVTNVVSPEYFKGRHIVYLPKYMPFEDPVNSMDDDTITTLFVENLKKVFPRLMEDEILHKRLFRQRYAQPLQQTHLVKAKASFKTPLKGVYLANSSMIYNTTLNNNAILSVAKQAVDTILQDT